jgi:hypothetical protein
VLVSIDAAHGLQQHLKFPKDTNEPRLSAAGSHTFDTSVRDASRCGYVREDALPFSDASCRKYILFSIKGAIDLGLAAL